MRYTAELARDFPAYKTVELDAPDEVAALRLVTGWFKVDVHCVGDDRPYEPQWDLGFNDRVVSLTRGDGVVVSEGWDVYDQETPTDTGGSTVSARAEVLPNSTRSDTGHAESGIEIGGSRRGLDVARLLGQDDALAIFVNLVAQAIAPSGIGPHDLCIPAGWREKARALFEEARAISQSVDARG